MSGYTDKKKLTAEEVDALVQGIRQKELLKWFSRWGDAPWVYAVVTTLKHLPWILVAAMILRWEKLKPLFTDPLPYLRERWIYFAAGLLIFVLFHRFTWRQKAFGYFMQAKSGAEGFYVPGDHRIAKMGERRWEKLELQFRRWGQHKFLLILIVALVVPLAFFSVLFVINGLRNGAWSFQELMNGFEGGSFWMVTAIFVLFGMGMGYGIWKEIDENYMLMKKIKPVP